MSLNLIDTHAHLYAEEFLADFSEVIEGAQPNVRRILLPNIDENSATRMHLLCEQYPQLFVPMMGIHPCYIQKDWKKQIEWVENQLKTNSIYCAVGEIGIDLYWDQTLQKEQTEAFRAQINLAKKYALPIVIHARDSFDEIFEVLDQENEENLSGVFHCFTGTLEQAEKILGYGNFYLGVGGILTYKNSGLDQVIAQINSKYLILETDAPYLPPTPHRGKRNESAFLPLIAQKLAEVQQTSIEQIAEITTRNAQSLFHLS